MSNHYRVIDETTWERSAHCVAFRNCIEPSFCVTFEADITKFKEKVKAQRLSFTLAMVYAVCKCANEIENFRYRLLDGNVVLYDQIDASFTYLNKETELFKFVTVPMRDNMEEFVAVAAETALQQNAYFVGTPRNDIFMCSALPWVTFTHISHTNSGKKDNAMPLFDWGKYFKRDGKILIPISVQAHHSFVDGIHIGKYTKKLQDFFDQY